MTPDQFRDLTREQKDELLLELVNRSEMMGDVTVSGVCRNGDDGRELIVYFSEPISDDEMRAFRDWLRECFAGRDFASALTAAQRQDVKP